MIRVLAILFEAYRDFRDDDGPALAGYIAFSGLLGIFPFILVLMNLSALVLDPAQGQAAVDVLFDYAPPHVAQTLEPVLRDVLGGTSTGALTLSALAALWFSSNVFEAIRLAFDRAYDVADPRNWLSSRLIAMACVLLGAVAALLLGVLIVLGPVVIQVVEQSLSLEVPFLAEIARYAIGMSVFIGFVMFLHMILPRHRLRIAQLWRGVLISALIWVCVATGFSIYLGYSTTYASTYGALAGVAITLVFLYMSGMAIIYGATVNAVLARERR